MFPTTATPLRLLTVTVVLAILPALAGCLGSPDSEESAPSDSSLPAASTPCDFRVEAERIRAREIDIAVDPNDPDRMAGAMMVSIPSTRGFPPDDEPVWTRIVRSSDGGQTWRGADLSGWLGSLDIAASPFVGSIVIGDGVVAFLPDGTLLLLGIMIRVDYSYAMFSARFTEESLEPSDVVVFARGAYGDPRLAQLQSPGSVLYNDKEEVTVDAATGTVYASWMWRFNDPIDGVQSIPVVVMSTDGAKSWTLPKMLLGGLGGGLTTEEGNIGQFPFTTTDGQAHVVWFAARAGKMMIASAPTGTLDFGSPRAIADMTPPSGRGDALTIPLPSVAVGPTRDGSGEAVYVVWADGRNNDADIVSITSRDGAQTWSEPARVNDDALDNGRDQLIPVVAVSSAGLVGVHFIDWRDAANNDEYEAYAAISYDDGETFSNVRISSAPTRITNAAGQRVTGLQPHVGDYFGAAFTDDVFVAMWQDGRDGNPDEPFSAAYVCRLRS